MAKELTKQHNSLFEHIRQTDKTGNEFWSARELSEALEYSEYRHFIPVIERAKEACANSGQQVADHFEDVLEMINLGKTAQREVESVKLSRYACYLIVQNANRTHYEVGKKVRKTIQELEGTLPENLPVADSIKKIEKAKEPKQLKPKNKND